MNRLHLPPFFGTSESQWKLSELPKGGHQEWMLTCNVRCMEWALLRDRLFRLRLMSIQTRSPPWGDEIVYKIFSSRQ